MNINDVIATFGSVEKARERLRLQAGPWSIEERNTAADLALLGLDSLDAADTLNALLAAAEGCLHNYDVDVKEGAFYMEQEHDQFDILRAAIRRARGEQP